MNTGASLSPLLKFCNPLLQSLNIRELKRPCANHQHVMMQPCQLEKLIVSEVTATIVDKRIVGAPDLVAEVASPGTVVYDRWNKVHAYARAEVEEDWIVDPQACSIEVFVFGNQVSHSLGRFHKKAILPSRIIAGIESVHVEQFFA